MNVTPSRAVIDPEPPFIEPVTEWPNLAFNVPAVGNRRPDGTIRWLTTTG